MDVKVFRTFLELAKVRHFGRAAENLYLTQAAVSARIKQLENHFDAQLFTRDRNNIKLTSAGERLVGYAEVMVATLQQAKFELSLESGKALQLTLGGTPNIWDAYLQHCLSRITDTFEGYGFLAEVMGREQLNRGLLERTLDMAFALDPIKAEELQCKKWLIWFSCWYPPSLTMPIACLKIATFMSIGARVLLQSMPTATLKRQHLFKNVDGKNCVRFHFGERGQRLLTANHGATLIGCRAITSYVRGE